VFAMEDIVKLSREFVAVKGNQKLANQLKVAFAPSVVILDADGDELGRGIFSDEASLKKPLDAALKKYVSKEISWSESPSGTRPVLTVYVDDKKDSEELLKALTDRTLVKLHDRFEFVKKTYEKGSEEAKALSILQAPTVLITKVQDGKTGVIEKLGGKQSATAVKIAMLRALKKFEEPSKR